MFSNVPVDMSSDVSVDMSSDVSAYAETLYQLRLVSILSRVFLRYMESHQSTRRTRAGKILLKSGAQRSRDRAVVDFACELLVEDMLLSDTPDMVVAWMLDLGLTCGWLRWSEGDLMVTLMPSIGDCRHVVRTRCREAQASGRSVMRPPLGL
jgi:hypothetical protein